MSWSASGVIPATARTPEEQKVALDALQPSGNEPALLERLEQVTAAKEAALVVLQSGALGFGHPIAVSLGGHANPNHEPTENWSNDSISINVYQMPD